MNNYYLDLKRETVKKMALSSKNRLFLLSGVAGAGKTSLAEHCSAELGGDALFYQCHQWTDADELFVGIDVASAVAGDFENAYNRGVLAKAAELSHSRTVCVIIDELDKSSEHVENLFLDFLQTGRVRVQKGETLTAKLENLVVFFTTNETREHSEPFLRRVRRSHLDPLPKRVMTQVAHAQTGVDQRIAGVVLKILVELSNDSTSVQELCNACEDLSLANSKQELWEILQMWGGRGGKAHYLLSTLWGWLT